MIKKDIVSREMLKKARESFLSSNINRLLMDSLSANPLSNVAMSRDTVVNMNFTFSHEIKTGEITNQQHSGRCWLFAGLNTLRVFALRNMNLKTFELSQSYQMFYDKLEKSNLFLENIIETADSDIYSREVMWLLASPVADGGQWDMFVNLVNKYGVVPKDIMPESYHSSNSYGMNKILTVKLREDARILRDMHKNGKSIDEIRDKKSDMIAEIYGMLCMFLGVPPLRFDFEYRDKDDVYNRDTNLTPQDFFEKYVKLNLTDYVSLINAPTQDKPFNKMYTVKFLGNVKEGRPVLYLNTTSDVLKELSMKQIVDNHPVWFGCDVGQFSSREKGIMDTELFDYEALFGVKFNISKADRLNYGESRLTHAMVFTGVDIVDNRPVKWKVENSWGDKNGKKGFFVMSDKWFDDFLYQIIVNKKYMSPALLEVLDTSPVELPPWDPMGSLAMFK